MDGLLQPLSKQELRLQAKMSLETLSQERRKLASIRLSKELFPKLSTGLVLSFASFGREIDLWPLNTLLFSEGRLCLPSLSGKLYRIVSLEKLPPKILEPDPLIQEEIDLDQIECILVPGLLFDLEHYRIGFGKGFYDRLLAKRSNIPCLGIGFHEQLSNSLLPRETHDQPVDHVLLV